MVDAIWLAGCCGLRQGPCLGGAGVAGHYAGHYPHVGQRLLKRRPVDPRRTLGFLARVGGDRGQREWLRLTRPHARHRLGVTVAVWGGREVEMV